MYGVYKQHLKFFMILQWRVLNLSNQIVKNIQKVQSKSSVKKFSPTERSYTTTDQECLYVYHALSKWKCYLKGTEFVLITYHSPLTYVSMEFFHRSNMTWEYIPGRTNLADPLCRMRARVASRRKQRVFLDEVDTYMEPRVPSLAWQTNEEEMPDVTCLPPQIQYTFVRYVLILRRP
jgi:RNase H-like domain found in reverse transcriptase